MGGAKCDLCQPFAFNLSSSGCESCGECELQLKESLEREEEILEAVSDQEQLVLRLAEVDQRGLGEVMGVASELRGSVEEVGVRLEGIEAKLGSVEDGLAESQETIFEIEERVSGCYKGNGHCGQHKSCVYNIVTEHLLANQARHSRTSLR